MTVLEGPQRHIQNWRLAQTAALFIERLFVGCLEGER